MATTSQKIMEIKFLVVILGALTPAPKMEEPVMKIPQAAPITDNPIQEAIPRLAQKYGETLDKKRPMLISSIFPVRSLDSMKYVIIVYAMVLIVPDTVGVGNPKEIDVSVLDIYELFFKRYYVLGMYQKLNFRVILTNVLAGVY